MRQNVNSDKNMHTNQILTSTHALAMAQNEIILLLVSTDEVLFTYKQ